MENQYVYQLGSVKRKILIDLPPEDMDKIMYIITEKFKKLKETYPNLQEKIILAYLSLDLATDLFQTKESLKSIEKRLDKILKESNEGTNRGI
jgi:cell division protein ZapA (FtsZ GTPase activity inhibitor)